MAARLGASRRLAPLMSRASRLRLGAPPHLEGRIDYGGVPWHLADETSGTWGFEGLRNLADSLPRQTFDSFEQLIPPRSIHGIPGTVDGGSSTRLGRNMFEAMGVPRTTQRSPYQAQHLIPYENGKPSCNSSYWNGYGPLVQRDISPNTDELSSTMSRHEGYHSVYNQVVERHLDRLDATAPIEILEPQAADLQQRLRMPQEQGVPLYKGQGSTVELLEIPLDDL